MLVAKNPPANAETPVQSLGWEDPLEEGRAPHSSILAWRIPWTDEPGRLQSMQLHKVRHSWSHWAAPEVFSITSLIKKKKKSQRKWHLFLRFKIFEQPKSMAQTLLVINKRTEIHPNSFIPPSKATWQDIHTWTSKTGTYLSLQSLTKTDKLTVTLAPVALFWPRNHLIAELSY